MENKATQKRGKTGDAENNKEVEESTKTHHEEPEPEKIETKETEKSPPVFDKTVIVVFLAVLLVTAVVVGGIYVSQKALKSQAERQSCQCPSPVCSPAIVMETSPSA